MSEQQEPDSPGNVFYFAVEPSVPDLGIDAQRPKRLTPLQGVGCLHVDPLTQPAGWAHLLETLNAQLAAERARNIVLTARLAMLEQQHGVTTPRVSVRRAVAFLATTQPQTSSIRERQEPRP